MPRQKKITFGEMRASGAFRIMVHCGDYKCGQPLRRWLNALHFSRVGPATEELEI
jgi:hypothetical protein